MAKAVYIHGFGGSIHSNTVGDLKKYYPQLEWCPLEVNQNVEESVAIINRFLSQNADVEFLIGSSLGGYYVLCADFAGHKLVVNPVLNPMSSLKKYIGTNKYRGRRENGDTEFKFTMQDLFRFKKFTPKDTPLTVCHYTANDAMLGADMPREYRKFFHNAEQTPDLAGHFMNEHYIKHKLGEVLGQTPVTQP